MRRTLGERTNNSHSVGGSYNLQAGAVLSPTPSPLLSSNKQRLVRFGNGDMGPSPPSSPVASPKGVLKSVPRYGATPSMSVRAEVDEEEDPITLYAYRSKYGIYTSTTPSPTCSSKSKKGAKTAPSTTVSTGPTSTTTTTTPNKMKTSFGQRLVQRQVELQQDNQVLRQAASLLTSKLATITADHQEAMRQIRHQQKRQRAAIYAEIKASCAAARQRQFEEDRVAQHDLDVLQETIATLRDTNTMIRRENNELQNEMEELQGDNDRLEASTARLQTAIRKAREEIAEMEQQKVSLEASVRFLQERKFEYEQARCEADVDIETAREEAADTRQRLERIVSELNARCPEPGLAAAIEKAVRNDFAMVEESSSSSSSLGDCYPITSHAACNSSAVACV